MKNYISVILFVLLAVGLSSCMRIGVKGSGVIDSENREIEKFSNIDVSGAFKLSVKFADEYNLEINAEDNILPLIKTYVKGNTLYIKTKRSISNRKDIVINLTMRELKSLDASGANRIIIDNLNTESFALNSSGANKIEMFGQVEKIKYNVSGACSILAQDLEADYVSVDISGACKVKLTALKKIKGDLSGASHIDLYGDPEYANIDAGYACSVKKKR